MHKHVISAELCLSISHGRASSALPLNLISYGRFQHWSLNLRETCYESLHPKTRQTERFVLFIGTGVSLITHPRQNVLSRVAGWYHEVALISLQSALAWIVELRDRDAYANHLVLGNERTGLFLLPRQSRSGWLLPIPNPLVPAGFLLTMPSIVRKRLTLGDRQLFWRSDAMDDHDAFLPSCPLRLHFYALSVMTKYPPVGFLTSSPSTQTPDDVPNDLLHSFS